MNDYATLAEDPQVLANGYITEVDPGTGEPPLRMVGLPVIFGKTPGKIRSLAPEFGQHTEEVLLETGFGWDEIAALRECGGHKGHAADRLGISRHAFKRRLQRLAIE